MYQDSSRFRTYAFTKRVFLKKTFWWMSQTGRGKEVEREKKREDRQQNVFLLSSVEKNLIETHRDAGNSLPYYAVSASSKVDE